MFSGYEGSLIRMSQICGMSAAVHQLYFCSLWCSHVKPLASRFKVNTKRKLDLRALRGLRWWVFLMLLILVTIKMPKHVLVCVSNQRPALCVPHVWLS